MQPSLARSVLVPIARRSRLAASSIASSSTASYCSSEAQAKCNTRRESWLSPWMPSKRLLLSDSSVAKACLDDSIRHSRGISYSTRVWSIDDSKQSLSSSSSTLESTASHSSEQQSTRQTLAGQLSSKAVTTLEPSSSTPHSTSLADPPSASADLSISSHQHPTVDSPSTTAKRDGSNNDTNDAASPPVPAQPTPWLNHLRNAASSEALSLALETASTRTRTLTTTLRSKLSTLSAQYNTYSGYSAIEELKTRISQLEFRLDSARSVASLAKKTYLSSVQSRSASQKETNDLLSRKNSWSEADLSRYTELLRKEHALSRQEAQAEKELERSEAEVQAAFDELMKAVMVRYHEEQIWSDRMRGWSTYGSLIVAGLNAFLFILAILLVEPYKRKKLAQTFESKLIAAEQQSRQLILASVDQFHHTLNTALTHTTQPASEKQVTQSTQSTQLNQQAEQPSEEANRPRIAREREEQLVFASTIGVIGGAALSLLISWCWT